MTNPTAYPLTWPAHRRRSAHREYGPFKHRGQNGRMGPVTLAVAMDRLEDELRRLGAQSIVLSTNIELRIDGRPRGGMARPHDPGVCAYFQLKGESIALACDRYTDVEQNIAALAAHVEATRAMTRHGVATANETLQAFSALPPPSAENRPARPWHEVLGVLPTSPKAVIDAAYRELVKKNHPDAGGSESKLVALNRAREEGHRACGE